MSKKNLSLPMKKSVFNIFESLKFLSCFTDCNQDVMNNIFCYPILKAEHNLLIYNLDSSRHVLYFLRHAAYFFKCMHDVIQVEQKYDACRKK